MKSKFDKGAIELFKNVKLLVLWMTNDCNLRCRYCYACAGEKKDYMNFETAKKAIDTLGDDFKLQLAGGEPILNFKLIKEIYEYLRVNKPKVKLQMQTNGALIDSTIAHEIKKMGIAVGVSFDGPVKINESLRGSTSEVIAGIKALAEEGIMVNLNCVLTEENVEYLDRLVEMAIYLGNVGGIGIDLLRETGRAYDNSIKKASPDKIRIHLRDAYSRANELSKIIGRMIIIREIEDARKRLLQGSGCTDYCYAVNGGSVVVVPDGSMYPCSSLTGREEYYMGNVHNSSSQRVVKLKHERPESCRLCKYGAVCIGACPSRSIINSNTGGFTVEDCALRKTAFEIIEEEKDIGECINC